MQNKEIPKELTLNDMVSNNKKYVLALNIPITNIDFVENRCESSWIN